MGAAVRGLIIYTAGNGACIPVVGESYDYAKAAISLEHSNSLPWSRDCVQIHQTLFPPRGWGLGMRLLTHSHMVVSCAKKERLHKLLSIVCHYQVSYGLSTMGTLMINAFITYHTNLLCIYTLSLSTTSIYSAIYCIDMQYQVKFPALQYTTLQ